MIFYNFYNFWFFGYNPINRPWDLARSIEHGFFNGGWLNESFTALIGCSFRPGEGPYWSLVLGPWSWSSTYHHHIIIISSSYHHHIIIRIIITIILCKKKIFFLCKRNKPPRNLPAETQHPVQNRPWVSHAGGQDYGSLHKLPQMREISSHPRIRLL